jgi:hypothetical protein
MHDPLGFVLELPVALLSEALRVVRPPLALGDGVPEQAITVVSEKRAVPCAVTGLI